MTGLQKQVVPVQLGQGIDTQTDSKHVVPGKLLTLENAVFNKTNRLDKRFGYTKLSTSILGGGTLTQSGQLLTFNDELLRIQNQKLYSYSSSALSWSDKGSCASVSVRTAQVASSNYSQVECDSAAISGVSLFVTRDATDGLRAFVFDETTGAALLSNVLLRGTTGLGGVRCTAMGQYLYVFYSTNAGAFNLYCRRLDTASPTAFTSEVLVSTDSGFTNTNWDIVPQSSNSRILIAHNKPSTTGIKVGFMAVAPAAMSTTVTVAESAAYCLGIIEGPSGTYYLAYQNGAAGLRCTILSSSGTTSVAPVTVDAYIATNINRVTGYATSTGVKLFYEISNASTYKTLISTNTVSTVGAVGTAADFLRSVGIASKAFTYVDAAGNSNSYLAVVHSSVFQATFFLARSDGLLVAKQQYGNAGGLLSTACSAACNVWSLSGGIYSYALLNKTKLVSSGGTLSSILGVARTKIDFTKVDAYASEQMGGNLHIAGGVLTMYDGQSVVEHGFHLYPENLSASQSGAAGLANGSYEWSAVFEWVDAAGQTHRSAPSVPLSFTVSGGPRNVSVVVPTLRLTDKKAANSRAEVNVVLYRTEAGPGEIFYRTSSATSPTFNSTTTDTVTIVDTTTDANLISGEILYTDAGTLDNIPPPACSNIAVYKDRLWLGGLEDGTSAWFSKTRNEQEPVEFAEELTLQAESLGGDISAMGVIDDKLLLFKADRFYFTYGNGPNNSGLDGEFVKPVFRAASVGCPSAAGLVRGATGGSLMVKADSGIYTIDASLTSFYTGADVEDFNSLVVTSSTLLSEMSQIRFTTSTGSLLVYDYMFNQWSTFTGLIATDAVLWRGSYAVLKTSGDLYVEDDTIYKDDGNPVLVKIGTGWMSLASVVGLQRIYKYSLLGEYRSAHTLTVSLGFDFATAYTETTTFDPSTALDAGAVPFAFTASIDHQKCQSLRLLIQETTSGVTAGTQEGFQLSTIGLLAGMKSGLGKFRAKQNLGTG